MIYVFLAIICFSMLTLSLKISGVRGANNNHVVLGNYVTAFVVSLIVSLSNGYFEVFSHLNELDVSVVFSEKSLAGTAFLVLATGLVSGFSFPINLLNIKDSISANGSAITSFFKQISTLGGLLVAIAFMGERPGMIQAAGIVLMAVAIFLMVSDFKQLEINNAVLLLIIFISGTIMETGNKLISKYAITGYNTVYLTVLFGVALVFILIHILRTEGGKITAFSGKDIFYGVLLGLSNLGNNFFKIKALEVLPASVVIPAVAVGALIITSLAGILFFKEKANRLYVLALVLAVVSIIMLNV
ncbi:MAG: EamA family transporter [Lachnospiraceae bacterium]|nr:EamA family transporter [Candidatus Darwinimomas equi]